MPTELEIDGRSQRRPDRPAVVICLDGCEPANLDRARAAGAMPALAGLSAAGGSRHPARSVMPGLTNPGNLSIACGVPLAARRPRHLRQLLPEPRNGCGGDDERGRIPARPTVLAAVRQAGTRVAVVAAKDRLRALLGAGLD